jgi:hypothetical protein
LALYVTDFETAKMAVRLLVRLWYGFEGENGSMARYKLYSGVFLWGAEKDKKPFSGGGF